VNYTDKKGTARTARVFTIQIAWPPPYVGDPTLLQVGQEFDPTIPLSTYPSGTNIKHADHKVFYSSYHHLIQINDSATPSDKRCFHILLKDI
jgi:hypothetical protein